MSVKKRVAHELLGPWMCHDQYFEPIVDMALSAEPREQEPDEAPERTEEPEREFEAHNGIAVLATIGPTVKYESFLTEWFGFVSTIRQQELLRQMRNDDSIRAVIHVIDSPGGTARDAPAFANALAETDRVKPVFTFATDLCASAGLFAGSQGRFFGAHSGTWIGSIGARAALVDSTKFWEERGFKIISIATGKYKDLGADGKVVTKDDIAEIKQELQVMADQFIEAIARGRHMSVAQVRELADGRIWIAEEAKARGLIDAVMSWREFVAHVAGEVGISVDPDRFEIRSAGARAWKPAESGERERCELRNAATTEVSEDTGRIYGYAVKWGELSVPLRRRSDSRIYRERFVPGAFTEALADPNLNAKARVDHVGGLHTIGRTRNGTLLLHEDDVGLHYEIIPPPTTAGREATILIDRKYIDGASVSFLAAAGGDRWLTEHGELVREVFQASVLDDVSPTDDPAFLGSTAHVEQLGTPDSDASAHKTGTQDSGATEKKCAAAEKSASGSTCEVSLLKLIG